ncbi:MAG: hypothetical protein R2828_00845 [Saprospiraceae bacterium]
METQNAAYFQKEILPKLNHKATIQIVSEVIDHAKTLEATMEEGKPRDQKPKPDLGKCNDLRIQLNRISKQYPESDLNKDSVKGDVERLLDYTEQLEGKVKNHAVKAE